MTDISNFQNFRNPALAAFAKPLLPLKPVRSAASWLSEEKEKTMTPKYECLRKIITLTVEYADFGGEENFVTEENVLAETFSEAEKVLACYLEGRQYHIISYCWKHSVISTPPNNACSGLAASGAIDGQSSVAASH